MSLSLPAGFAEVFDDNVFRFDKRRFVVVLRGRFRYAHRNFAYACDCKFSVSRNIYASAGTVKNVFSFADFVIFKAFARNFAFSAENNDTEFGVFFVVCFCFAVVKSYHINGNKLKRTVFFCYDFTFSVFLIPGFL